MAARGVLVSGVNNAYAVLSGITGANRWNLATEDGAWGLWVKIRGSLLQSDPNYGGPPTCNVPYSVIGSWDNPTDGDIGIRWQGPDSGYGPPPLTIDGHSEIGNKIKDIIKKATE